MSRAPANSIATPDWYVQAKNTSDTTAPSQGVGEIVNRESPGLLAIRRPNYSGLTRLCLIPQDIAAGGQGRIQQDGEGLLEVTIGAGETLTAGDRVGCKRKQWTAQADQLGPFLIEEVIDEVPSEGGDVTCLVRFDRRRGDHQYVRDNTDDVAGPFQTLVFGVGYTVATDGEPGKITVTKS